METMVGGESPDNSYPITSRSINSFEVFSETAINIGFCDMVIDENYRFTSDIGHLKYIVGLDNVETVIYKNYRKLFEAFTKITPNILKNHKFWIRLSSGIIEIGITGNRTPFISCRDPEPESVVCAALGAETQATWSLEGRKYTTNADDYPFFTYTLNGGGLDVQVKVADECHIFLMDQNKPVYEIILSNRISILRAYGNKECTIIDTARTSTLLSSKETRRFFIEWNNKKLVIRAAPPTKRILLQQQYEPTLRKCTHFGVTTPFSFGTWRIRCYDPNDPRGFPCPDPTDAPVDSVGGGTWIQEKLLPLNALIGGYFNEIPQYVARAVHGDGLYPGRLVPKECLTYISHNGTEYAKSKYEILCNCPGTWKPASGGDVLEGAIPGGLTNDGEPLFIGRRLHEGALIIGKIQSSRNCLFVTYQGSEMSFSDYEVLVTYAF